VERVAQGLEEVSHNGGANSVDEMKRVPAGWIRGCVRSPFNGSLSPHPRRRRSLPRQLAHVCASQSPSRGVAPKSIDLRCRTGVVICLPEAMDETHLPLLLDGAKVALDAKGAGSCWSSPVAVREVSPGRFTSKRHR